MTEQQYIELTKKFQGQCNCVTPENIIEEDDFRNVRCDCCNAPPGIRHDVIGYNPDNGHIEQLGTICHECLLYFAYGELPEMVE